MNILDNILKKTKVDAFQMNVLALAFIGDAIHSLYVRNELILKADFKQKDLQRLTSKVVRARNQANALDFLVGELSEEEKDLAKRARNAKTNNIAKNSSIEEYKKSTSFEALVGYFYLTENEKKLSRFLSVANECAEKGEESC